MEKLHTDYYGKDYDAMIYWYITDKFNFTCPQCAGSSHYVTTENIPPIDLDLVKRFLEGLDRTVRISFTGGEPLLVENFIEILKEITRKHYVSIVTNLVNEKVLRLANELDPQKFTFVNASAHMAQLNSRKLLDLFISNCQLIQDKGFNINVTEVAYPFIKNKANEYREIFKQNGIDLDFMAFRGVWGEKHYPDSYTEDEKMLFRFEKCLSLSPEIFNRKGQLCNAWYNSVVIMHDERIIPCFQMYENQIGSLQNGFKFANNMIRCPYDFCGCPVPAFEEYLYKKALQNTENDITESDIDN